MRRGQSIVLLFMEYSYELLHTKHELKNCNFACEGNIFHSPTDSAWNPGMDLESSLFPDSGRNGPGMDPEWTRNEEEYNWLCYLSIFRVQLFLETT